MVRFVHVYIFTIRSPSSSSSFDNAISPMRQFSSLFSAASISVGALRLLPGLDGTGLDLDRPKRNETGLAFVSAANGEQTYLWIMLVPSGMTKEAICDLFCVRPT